MSFAKRSASLRSKLHLSDVSTLSLVGIVAAAVLVVVVLAFFAIRLFVHDGAELVVSADVANTASVADSSAESFNDVAENTDSLWVHVAGEVNNPGLYELSAGSRVWDAIEAAGGFTDEANQSALNLARVLTDGEQLMVPAMGEDASGGAESASNASGTTSSGSTSSGTDGYIINGRVNINRADAATLQSLPGIGEVTAAKIIADREANGAYGAIEDIKRVSGIGDKKYEAIADLICIG